MSSFIWKGGLYWAVLIKLFLVLCLGTITWGTYGDGNWTRVSHICEKYLWCVDFEQDTQFILFVFEPHLVVLRCLLLTLHTGNTPRGFRTPCGILGIESGSTAYKTKHPSLHTISGLSWKFSAVGHSRPLWTISEAFCFEVIPIDWEGSKKASVGLAYLGTSSSQLRKHSFLFPSLTWEAGGKGWLLPWLSSRIQSRKWGTPYRGVWAITLSG